MFSHPSPPAVEPWFEDTFESLDLAVWTEYNQGTGHNAIVSGKLEMHSEANGDYAYMETAHDDTAPSAYTLYFKLNILTETGAFVLTFHDGTHALWVWFSDDTTLTWKTGAFTSTDYPITSILNSESQFKFVNAGDTTDIYQDGTLVASAVSNYDYTSHKGAIYLSCDDVEKVQLDDLYIYPA